jgi:hypothetical protein
VKHASRSLAQRHYIGLALPFPGNGGGDLFGSLTQRIVG